MTHAQDKSVYLAIVLSTVDTPIDFRPSAHVNVESKATWYEPYDGIPSFQTLPDGIL
jgi:hypothetical protein